MVYKLLLFLILLLCIIVPFIKIEHYIDPIEMENTLLEAKQAEDKYNTTKQDKINLQKELEVLQQTYDKLENDLAKCKKNNPDSSEIVYTESEKKEKKNLLIDYNQCFKEMDEIKQTTIEVKDEYIDAKEDFQIFKQEYDDLNKKIKDLRRNKIPQIEKEIDNIYKNIDNANRSISNFIKC
jgi:predicted  nucleic acid-binding Zn-ribbon protein